MRDSIRESRRDVLGIGWITLRLTANALWIIRPPAMLDAGPHTHKISALSSAAGYLCSSLKELALSECNAFAADVLDVLSAIDGEIASLEREGGAAPLIEGR